MTYTKLHTTIIRTHLNEGHSPEQIRKIPILNCVTDEELNSILGIKEIEVSSKQDAEKKTEWISFRASKNFKNKINDFLKSYKSRFSRHDARSIFIIGAIENEMLRIEGEENQMFKNKVEGLSKFKIPLEY